MAELSVPTLVFVTVIVAFTTSILLAISWLQNPDLRCLFFWAVSNLVGTLAAIMFLRRGVWPDIVSIHLANMTLFISAGIAWAGMRLFEGKPYSKALIAAGPIAWIALTLISQFEQSMAGRTVVSATIVAAYALATIWELWSGRSEKLMSRYPAMIVLGIHAIAYLVRIPASLMVDLVDERNFFASPIITFVAFETLIYVIAISFLRIALVKERAEIRNRLAAETDQLTGAFNRRAFFDTGLRAVEKAETEKQNCTLVLIDLDHFKQVNDRYGHAAGDLVLKEFASIARSSLGMHGHFARLGGEEFGAILVGMPPEDAFALTETMRAIVASTPILVEGRDHHVTISIGMAFSTRSGYCLEELMKFSDDALYCAKRNGRNRIECASAQERPPLPRIAA